MHIRFKNELGSDIALCIFAAQPAPGVAGLCLSIAGPRSLCENTLTRREAEELSRVLSAWLAAHPAENPPAA